MQCVFQLMSLKLSCGCGCLISLQALQRVLNMHRSVVPVVCVESVRDFLAVTQSSRNQTFVCLIAVLYKYC